MAKESGKHSINNAHTVKNFCGSLAELDIVDAQPIFAIIFAEVLIIDIVPFYISKASAQLYTTALQWANDKYARGIPDQLYRSLCLFLEKTLIE